MHIAYFSPLYISCLFPMLLFMGGLAKISPGFRFKLASFTILFIWSITCFFQTSQPAIGMIWFWFAGILWMLSIILFGFMLWSVLCWGYTLSMLLCLAKKQSTSDLQEWMFQYAGNAGINTLTLNRSTVLLSLRFARIENDALVLTPLGRVSAALIEFANQFFGIL